MQLYLQVSLAALIGFTCILGDEMVEYFSSRIMKAICDNVTHGLVGYLSAVIIAHNYKGSVLPTEKKLVAFMSYLTASVIDADHFIEARSFKLKDAISLDSRPFLHSSTYVIILLVIFINLVFLSDQHHSILWVGSIATGMFLHHIRDATRRGLWVSPFGSTPPIPYLIYVGLSMILPYIVARIANLNKSLGSKYMFLKSDGTVINVYF